VTGVRTGPSLAERVAPSSISPGAALSPPERHDSELKALVRQPTSSREVDRDALRADSAVKSIPAPMTIFRAARKLPAGHLLLCSPTCPSGCCSPAAAVSGAGGAGAGA
jgi:hypothetical protein